MVKHYFDNHKANAIEKTQPVQADKIQANGMERYLFMFEKQELCVEYIRVDIYL